MWIGVLRLGLNPSALSVATFGSSFYTRPVRGSVLSAGASSWRPGAPDSPDRLILVRHIVPQVISPVIVAFSLDLGAKILATAGLSFLDLGTQPPTADWGSMLATGQPPERARIGLEATRLDAPIAALREWV